MSHVVFARVDSNLKADLVIVAEMCQLPYGIVLAALMHKAIQGIETPAWPIVRRAILIHKRNVN